MSRRVVVYLDERTAENFEIVVKSYFDSIQNPRDWVAQKALAAGLPILYDAIHGGGTINTLLHGQEPDEAAPVSIQAAGKRRPFPRAVIAKVAAACQGKCVGCGVELVFKVGPDRLSKAESRRRFTVDHIVPLCAGGKNDANNLQALCKRCNSRKGGKVVTDSAGG